MSKSVLLRGDCLVEMSNIPDKSIDMILCDLPYGTTEHLSWDVIIPFDSLWEQYERIISDNGAIVLTACNPFTSQLIISNLKLFKYTAVWQKSKCGGAMMAPYRPLKEHEDIVVFSKGKTTANGIPRMRYNPQGLTDVNKIMSNSNSSSASTDRTSTKNKKYIQTKMGYPKTILKFSNESKTFHPTQKPIALLEYLIKTYTNEKDVVLDNCMGSGSTGVACVNTNRRFIGIEKEDEYFKIAETRISKAEEEATNAETNTSQDPPAA